MLDSDYITGNELFKKSYFKKHEKELIELAEKGQQPKALYIGCSDSRVLPNLITQSSPGDLFVVRNVGNFVAPFKPDEDFHSTAAAIEYAVTVLNVEEIIICGHTQCGAIKALFEPTDNPEMIHTKHWLSLGQEAKTMASIALGPEANQEELERLTEQLSVVSQIKNLLTYPAVKKRVDEGKIYIHGWMYDIHTGNIQFYDPESNQYLSMESLKKNKDL